MHKPQQQVQEFHKEVLGVPSSPAKPVLRNSKLRAKLILEEAFETVIALVGPDAAADVICDEIDRMIDKCEPGQPPNLVEVIDGLCDTIVVCYGTAEDIGIDLEPFFDEVMRTNMAKKDGPIRMDGKRLKPPGWTPPDIKGILARVKGEQK